MSTWVRFYAALLVPPALLACAGVSPPSAASPPPANGATAAPAPSKPAPLPEVAVPEVQPEAAGFAAPSSADGDTKPLPAPAEPARRALRELLTTRDLAFMIDYPASAPHAAAEAACSDGAGGDPALRAECMTKARNGFQADVLRFRKDDQGRVFWVTYKRVGNTLTELHTARFEFGDETPDSITLLLKGPETGKRLLFKGVKTIAVSAPDESTLVLDEPALGRLVYKAKIGLVGQ